ncbi:GST-like protein [Paraburkholderia sp. BL23I1N1]|uniref:glutathione S-transferase family protein n=1 Tax=Paraburkholderia sp. BL23I1N1 TaxID=1938802 RepID=UPI000E718CC2|nr:glutathione S-transferase family protein [Paraburkholderia sp. BL23I1N1]RKE38677.1 GST-like protein [Paraburkholderia sp. BL23I1N1]
MDRKMILYAADSPNGHRAVVFMEEMAVPYELRVINLLEGGASTPELLALNPRARVPVLVDLGAAKTPRVLWQSWSIGAYLADKCGAFIPAEKEARDIVLEWLFFVGTDVAMAHSTLYAVTHLIPEKAPSITGFYEQRVLRVFRDIDRQLAVSGFLCGELSIADLALYPIFNSARALLNRYPELDNLQHWGNVMDARPGCKRGVGAFATGT